MAHWLTNLFLCQLNVREPLRKRLWQLIVSRKIASQARVLAFATGEDAGLAVMSRQVASGDPDNREACASDEYARTIRKLVAEQAPPEGRVNSFAFTDAEFERQDFFLDGKRTMSPAKPRQMELF